MGLCLQKGIYYSEDEKPGNSFSIIFLSVENFSDSLGLRDALLELWQMYCKLEVGQVGNLPGNRKTLHHGNLSVMLGFGPTLFDLQGIKRTRPTCLDSKWLFNKPNPGGGGPLLDQVGLLYDGDIIENPISNEQMVIQFIGDTQLATHRAVVETWKLLRKVNEKQGNKNRLVLRHFFTGFNRPDRRGWLGFHDGVSNIRPEDRLNLIRVKERDASRKENWTVWGTYLTFVRIIINLSIWEKIDITDQERIVGRNKMTGCPLVGIYDKNDLRKNIIIRGCPVAGTSEIVEKGNEHFRDHPPYGRTNVYGGMSDRVLTKSHIGRMYKRSAYEVNTTRENRIFRQGYEFLESMETSPYFRVGLNFISFQAKTSNLYNVFKFGLGGANFGGDDQTPIHGSDKLLSVRAAGMFYVPPCNEREQFPGESMFV